MNKEECEDLTLYKFNQAQDVDMLQFRYSLHKSVLHVPSCVIVDHPLDWKLMERALNMEIERNDCMRLRFVKTEDGIKQYYIPEYSVSDIPVDDFRGMDEEKAKKLLHKRGSRPVLDFLRGEVFRIRFFRAHDGRCGVYLCACHLIMDLAAEFVFYKDLLGIYYALENGKEFPKPLDKSEDMLKRELEKMDNVRQREKDKDFFKEYFNAHSDFCYAGIHGTKLLDAYRKKKKDPSKKFLSLPTIIFDKTRTVAVNIDAALSNKIYSYLKEQNISLTALFSLVYRTYLSSVNNRAETILSEIILDRRSTLVEKNCGGNRAASTFVLTTFPEDITFKDALTETYKTLMRLYTHIEIHYNQVNAIMREVIHVSNLAEQSCAMIMSCMPPVSFPEELQKWNPDFHGFSNGHFPMLDYTIIVPNERTGEIMCNYEYNVHYLSEDIIRKMHQKAVKAIEMGIEKPNLTLGQIMDSL